MLMIKTGKKTYVIRPTEFTKVFGVGLIGLGLGAMFALGMNMVHPLF